MSNYISVYDLKKNKNNNVKKDNTNKLDIYFEDLNLINKIPNLNNDNNNEILHNIYQLIPIKNTNQALFTYIGDLAEKPKIINEEIKLKKNVICKLCTLFYSRHDFRDIDKDNTIDMIEIDLLKDTLKICTVKISFVTFTHTKKTIADFITNKEENNNNNNILTGYYSMKIIENDNAQTTKLIKNIKTFLGRTTFLYNAVKYLQDNYLKEDN